MPLPRERLLHRKNLRRIQFDMPEERNSTLTLEDRRKISLTGVESVDAFSDNCIRLTVSGVKLTVTGSKFQLLAFSEGNGSFSAVGVVDALRYGGGKKRSLFS